MASQQPHWHRILAHAAGALPLVVLVVDYSSGALGAIPERTAMLRTGAVGLALLIASFACTPIATLSGRREVIRIRRALGVYGFLYATLHIAIYLAYDGQFDPALVARDLFERNAMSIGLLAFAFLVPLALTSTAGWQRRLGKRWRTLHRLVYLAVPLSALHFLWLDRDHLDVPIATMIIVGLLLIARWPPLRRRINRLRGAS